MNKQFNRVILKLSGEALAGNNKTGIDMDTMDTMAKQIKKVTEEGIEVSIVVGGGNFWRGRDVKLNDRAASDYVGMLGTVMNAISLQDALEANGVETRVQTAIEMKAVAEPYIRRRAIRHLEKGRVVIFAAGSGNPYFSTDTTAALRAAEIDADVILLAKKGTDGIYTADPNKDPSATKYDNLSYLEILNSNLKIMDATATSLCMDNEIPLIVFGIDDSENIYRAAIGENIGTIVEG